MKVSDPRLIHARPIGDNPSFVDHWGILINAEKGQRVDPGPD
jgi:hypothetical protein